MRLSTDKKIRYLLIIPFFVTLVVFALVVVLSVAQIEAATKGIDSQSLSSHIESLQSTVLQNCSGIMTALLVFFALAIALFAFFSVYYIRTVSKPLQVLTRAADEISTGNIDVKITDDFGGTNDIALLSGSLHRMVEQFRVFIFKQERSFENQKIYTQLSQYMQNNNDAKKIMDSVCLLMAELFNAFKITAILSINESYKIVSFYSKEHGLAQTRELPHFRHQSRVRELIADKKMLYFNLSALAEYKINFISPETTSVCFLPLSYENQLLGYIILENDSILKPLYYDDATLLFIADTLSAILAKNETDYSEPAASPGTKEPTNILQNVENVENVESVAAIPPPDAVQPNFVPTVRSFKTDTVNAVAKINGLDVAHALENMGGLEDIYEKTMKLSVTLLPASIAKLDATLANDLQDFAIEVHGTKGALNNMGAFELGRLAHKLEKAAKSYDPIFCTAHYPAFKEKLSVLCTALETALENLHPTENTEQGDPKALIGALRVASQSCDQGDCMLAQETLAPLMHKHYPNAMKNQLHAIYKDLEVFDFEQALMSIDTLLRSME